MEWLLDAQTHSAIPKMEALLRADTGATSDDVNPERSDVHKADTLEQEENRDDTPHRYERLYWETMSEDADVRIKLVPLNGHRLILCSRNQSCPTSFNTSKNVLNSRNRRKVRRRNNS